MLYFWFKKGAEEGIKALRQQGLLGEKLEVKTDGDSGRKYISVYEDPSNPASEIPSIPEELIEKVTIKDYHIYQGFRTEGIYRHEGAVLMLKIHIEIERDFKGGGMERLEWQDVSISAPSVETLKAIYTMVRQGKLKPEEDWEHYSPKEIGSGVSLSPDEKTV
ncbi:MAG: hypothetical protein Q8N56_03770 [bacterium]|nr:hypothetical protein [bacterium]